MATPFARSVRSIQSDSFRSSLIGLSLAMVLMAAWMGWFFLARVTLYEHTDRVRITGREAAIATFPAGVEGRIKPGQLASLVFQVRGEDEPRTISAIVTDVDSQSERSQVRVTLFLLWDTRAALEQQDIVRATCEIEVEYASPATLVMRAVGKGVETPDIRTSPQIYP
jgi:hypothetical protein